MKLETIDQQIRELVATGASPQDVVRTVMRTLSDKAARALAEEYIATMAGVFIRAREHVVRRGAVGLSARGSTDEVIPRRKLHGSRTMAMNGCECTECVAYRDFDADLNARLQADLKRSMDAALEKYAAELRVEWTAELLASSFGVPGGRVTWADATVDDHRSHMTIDAQAIDGYQRDIALHHVAIEAIEKAGVTCLAELVAAHA